MAFGGMKEWMLLFEGLVLVFIAGSFSHQVAGARTLITGEPCVIPFSFNGEVFNDCMQFSGEEWCVSASNAFGVCKPVSAVPDVAPLELPAGVPSATRVDKAAPIGVITAPSDCCDLLTRAGFSFSLPVIVLDSRGKAVPDEPKVGGIMCTCGSPGGDVSQPMGIEIRGSTSARDFSKKSFAMETRNREGKDERISLLGLGVDSDWILYGPEMDKTMGMKNYLTMSLYRDTGRYSSGVVFCELFLIEDGGALDLAHYNGLYILMEKVKRDKARVDVNKHKEEDISGGYIFKYDNDNFDPGDRIFTTDFSKLKFVLTYPKKDKAEDHHLSWIGTYVSNFEEALASGIRANWLPFIDEGSFIDIFLLTELTKNPDGYRGSFYFHKETGKPLSAGPPWDYNEAYGTCCGYPIEGFLEEGISDGLSGGSAISPEGWRFNICIEPERCQIDPIDGVSRWFQSLMTDDTFRSSAAARWKALRATSWSDTQINAIFADAVGKIQDPVGRNHDRWSIIHGNTTHSQYIATWSDEVNTIRSWLSRHMAWMDSQFAAVSSGLTPTG